MVLMFDMRPNGTDVIKDVNVTDDLARRDRFCTFAHRIRGNRLGAT